MGMRLSNQGLDNWKYFCAVTFTGNERVTDEKE